MSEETKRYDSRDGTVTATKKEILGKTYLVIVYPERSGTRDVYIFGDTVEGGDVPFPNELYEIRLGDEYDCIASKSVDVSKNLSPEIAKGVNEAVIKLEDTLEDTSSTEDAVLGALDANKEVHEEEL